MMNIVKYNIGVSQTSDIYFSHIVDQSKASDHSFHLHDYIELFFYISGDADFILNDTYFHLEPGDIVIAPENILHKPIIKSTTRYERFYIGLPRTTFAEMNRVRNPLYFIQEEGQMLLRPDKKACTMIQNRLNSIATCIEQTYAAKRTDSSTIPPYPYTDVGVQIYVELLRLLLLLAEIWNGEVRHQHANEKPLPSLIAKMLPYLEHHIDTINSVEELAHTLNVTPSYLSALFSRSMNVPLKQYIVTKKIAQAKKRLQQGESVTDTAFACGFCTVSHFIVVFQRVMGITPNKYRNIETSKNQSI